MKKAINVLFLCTGNSARSSMSEAYLRQAAAGRFNTFSAGSRPVGAVNPLAIETLVDAGVDTAGLGSKSWDVFAAPDAPKMDIIITVCDNAAGETCPIWPGHPSTAHWGMPDPAAAGGSKAEKLAAFAEVFAIIRRLSDDLIAQPDEALAPEKRRETLAAIGARHLGAGAAE